MKRIIVGIVITIALVLTGIGAWYLTVHSTIPSGVSESITIGEKPYETNALFYIAED